MDIVLKLREARRLCGLTQREASRLSGVGEKTISSFETGLRVEHMKVTQLLGLLRVYGITEAEFFGGKVERQSAPWELSDVANAVGRLTDRLNELPPQTVMAIVEKFDLIIEGATAAVPSRAK